MNSVSRTITFIFILIFLANNCFAQKVTNISAEQVGQTIQVYYNLETESPCTISLFYSTDNGSSWQGPLQKVSGDVGEKIMKGNKTISWELLSELDQLKFSEVIFKVNARKTSLKEVKIGSQIWNAENLNTDWFANGELILEAKSDEALIEAGKNKKAAWCYYNNDSSLGAVYGKLYNWYAVTDSRGLCPIGWHVPALNEWETLETFLDDNGSKLKEIGHEHWATQSNINDNSSGFTALPGGYFANTGQFMNIALNGIWWSTNSYNNLMVNLILLEWNDPRVLKLVGYKDSYYSVRCIKD